MKTILIMRHAKSDWSRPGLPDFDRPLKKRGRRDAPLMGRVLKLYDSVPARILASPALRARQTAELAAAECGGFTSPELEMIDGFYPGSTRSFLESIRALPNSIDRVMLLGHNPAMEDAAAEFLGGPVFLPMPTAGLVCLEANAGDWSKVKPGGCFLRWFIVPKLIRSLVKN